MIIRAAENSDAPAIRDIYAPFVRDTAVSFEDAVPDLPEIARRIVSVSDKYPFLVSGDGETVTGFAYAGAHRTRAAFRSSVEVSIYIAPAAQGRGIGRALYERLLSEIEARGFHAALAAIALPNARSVALHEACGFTHVGVFREVGTKFGQWHDVGWWQRLL